MQEKSSNEHEKELTDIADLDVAARRPDHHRRTSPSSKRGGGPRSPAGRKAVSTNAVTHGILSDKPVVLGESIDDWDAHHEGVRQSLAPVGHLEELLARRVALREWQLSRLERYELGVIQNQFELVDHPDLAMAHEPGDLLDDEGEWTDLDPYLAVDVLSHVFDRDEDSQIGLAAAVAIMRALDETVRPPWDTKDLQEFLLPMFDLRTPWTVGYVRQLLGTIGRYIDEGPEEVADRCLIVLQIPSMMRHERMRRDVAIREQKRRTMAIPAEKDLERIMRYRRSLEGSRDRARRELEISQRARAGDLPAPVRIDLA